MTDILANPRFWAAVAVVITVDTAISLIKMYFKRLAKKKGLER